MRRKAKKIPSERIEHIIQFPLMENCLLSFQVNQISGGHWSVGFPKDEIVYPISDEAAHTILQAASNRVPVDWMHRTMSEEELKFLIEHTQKCSSCHGDAQEVPVAKASVDQFVSDMGRVWEAKQPQILEVVRKLNDMINACNLPVMEAIFSLAMTTLMGASTVGAHGVHVASLIMSIAEHVKLQVKQMQSGDVTN